MKLRNKYTWMGALFIASVAGGVVACSSSDDNNGGTNDGKDAGPGQDGGGTNDDGGGQEPASKKSGSVSVGNFILSGRVISLASAGFSDATDLPDQSGTCQKSTEGACTIVKCGTITSGDAGAPKPVSAGAVEVSGGDISPTIKLEPKSDNTYEPVNGATPLWKGGEDISIKAAGSASGVGAFEKTLKAPPTIAISDVGQTIDLTKALEVSWTFPGAAGGDVVAAVSTASKDGSVSVACKAGMGDKKVTLPASALGNLPKGQGFFSVSAGSSELIKVSDYTVNVTATSSAKRQDGSGASGNVTLQ